MINLYASNASKHPTIFGTGPITGGTPLVNFDISALVSSPNSFPSDGSEKIS